MGVCGTITPQEDGKRFTNFRVKFSTAELACKAALYLSSFGLRRQI